MLDYSFTGKIPLEKYNIAREKLQEEVESLNSRLEEKGLSHFSPTGKPTCSSLVSRTFGEPKIIFSLIKQKLQFGNPKYTDVEFNNEISWKKYYQDFKDVYEEFAETHKNLIKFYEEFGIKDFSKWSEWSSEEKRLFQEKDLNSVYSPKGI